MYQLIKELHSLSAYIVLAVLIAAVLNAVIGFLKKKEFKVNDLRISLFALIFSHLQLLLGLLLYLSTPRLQMWGEGFKIVMKDKTLRLVLVEHPLMVLIAVTLITIGWSQHKKQVAPQRKFGKIALFYGIALVAVLSMLPWRLWWFS
jgi:hypothetical protein